ncbi:selection and upkeep of intraepithelial T-cells protein 7-like [Oreochromis niloticus]|uniref:selection and upkeep of intraepithelial T-cells protein 7-like n=1 Tax=Oreochromis niloticus TaxID=8128 RepID=UPI0003940CAE|nr:selection and upkeep of intraepithelial T-cells protein 7-like [Oreochromis niloticus]XP_025759650.1 selection and upkeep of intraepithelial T-cells protein 7-like [Oreochromis niloticus]
MPGISLLSVLLFIMQMTASSTDQTITAEYGQNATLTCQAPNNNTIIIVEWSRADLGNEYVLVYRDGQFPSDEQHPSFKNRVDLQDRQMKDGDVSLILNNVTINDTGTYECRVFMEETQSWEHSSIYLSVVVPPGQTGGHTEDGGKKDFFSQLILGLIVSAIYIATIVHVICTIRRQQQDID